MKHTLIGAALLGLMSAAPAIGYAETVGIPVRDQYTALELFHCYRFWHGGVLYAINVDSFAAQEAAGLVDHAIANNWMLDIKIWSDAAAFDQDFYPRATPCGGGNTISKFAHPINITVIKTP